MGKYSTFFSNWFTYVSLSLLHPKAITSYDYAAQQTFAAMMRELARDFVYFMWTGNDEGLL